MKFLIVVGATLAMVAAASAADLTPRPQPVYQQPPIGKAPVGKGPVGKGPVGKGPVGVPY